MKCSLGISNFLEEISSLSHSVVSLYFFALITEGGFLISSCYSLELCIQMFKSFFPFLLFFSLLFFSQLFVRPPQTAILLLCISFSWGWSWSLSPEQCHKPQSIVHQALYLSDLIPWIYLSLPLYNHKGFDLGQTCIGKDPDAGRDWEQKEKGTTKDEMAGWHHRLDAHEFGWTPLLSLGQASADFCFRDL